jgi:ABC-type ATPase involved in cell division
MIIRLTNASKDFKGQEILINTRHIISVFQDNLILDDKTVEIVSNIYAVTQQSWVVKETVNEIFKMIQDRTLI